MQYILITFFCLFPAYDTCLSPEFHYMRSLNGFRGLYIFFRTQEAALHISRCARNTFSVKRLLKLCGNVKPGEKIPKRCKDPVSTAEVYVM